jgi:hypothetical protein
MVSQALPMSSGSIRGSIKAMSHGHAALDRWGARYALARLYSDEQSQVPERWALFATKDLVPLGADVTIASPSALVLDRALPPGSALLVPPLVAVLRIWDDLRLELGELAVVTDGHPLSRLAAVTAAWHGADTRFVSANDAAPPAGATVLRLGTHAEPITLLTETWTSAIATGVAVDFSGSAEIVDALLETIPSASRLLLAGQEPERLTVDFYRNVHRKGLELLSLVAGPGLAFDASDPPRQSRLVTRACRVLADARLLEQCVAAMTIDAP